MNISGIMINDEKKGVFFAYIKQFPGICAQAETAEEANRKVNHYFKKYIEKMSQTDVEMVEEPIVI